MKKRTPRIILAVIALVALSALTYWYLVQVNALPPVPQFPITALLKGQKIVALKEPVRLTVGEVVQIENSDSTLEITGFTNSPCPAGANCIWSGQEVLYRVTTGDRVIEGSHQRPQPEAWYTISVTESDYETYAVVIISPTGLGLF